MIVSFKALNYRGFGDDLSLWRLRRVNVITGSNGSGKTALLEALLIAAKGNPEGAIRVSRLRTLGVPAAPAFFHGGGFSPISPLMPMPVFRNLWEHLFRDPTRPLFLTYSDDTALTRSVEVSFGASENVLLETDSTSAQSIGSARPVIFKRRRGNVESFVSARLDQSGQVAPEFAPDLGPTTFLFAANTTYNEADNVQWLSELRLRKKLASVTNAVIQDFPFITELEILAPYGVQAVYASLKSGDVRPLSLVSAGLHKLFSLYCGLSFARDGVILIDEIENGVYYELYEAMWRHLYEICIQPDNQNQLFVTSHSLECLKALLPIVEQYPDDFSLIQTERRGDGCIAHQVSGQAMQAALAGEVELRGATYASAESGD